MSKALTLSAPDMPSTNRREVLMGMAGMVGLTAAAEVARANTEQTEASLGASAMNHRSYRGKMLYLTDGVGATGREWFHVTIQPDGTRTMRATCEMDDDRLLRDVTLTADKDWYPVDAFVRLSIKEKLVGSSWFHFTEDSAECEGFTVGEGRFSQHFETEGRTGFFGAHQLHGDAWACATLARDEGLDESATVTNFSSSLLPNGGSGPTLVPTPSDVIRKQYLGTESIAVAAGSFEANHFQFLLDGAPPIDVWTLGSDFIPVRLRWDLLKQTYDLVELEGDIA